MGQLAIQGIHSGTQHDRGWALTRDQLRKAVLSYFTVAPGDTLWTHHSFIAQGECHGARVEDKGQAVGISSLLPPWVLMFRPSVLHKYLPPLSRLASPHSHLFLLFYFIFLKQFFFILHTNPRSLPTPPPASPTFPQLHSPSFPQRG